MVSINVANSNDQSKPVSYQFPGESEPLNQVLTSHTLSNDIGLYYILYRSIRRSLISLALAILPLTTPQLLYQAE